MHCYKYPRPALTTDAFVLGYNNLKNSLELLLIKRKFEPFQDKYALPGGFVNIDETLEECVARELAEETELLGVPLIQMKAFSELDRDPRGRTVSVVFFSLIESTMARTHGADDAEASAWFNILDLPELAFDHQKIVDYGIKFAYSNILIEADKQNFSEFSNFEWIIDYVGRKKLLNLLEQYVQQH